MCETSTGEFPADHCIAINATDNFTDDDVMDFDAFIAAIGNPGFG